MSGFSLKLSGHSSLQWQGLALAVAAEDLKRAFAQLAAGADPTAND